MANIKDTIDSLNKQLEGVSSELDKLTGKFNTATSNMAKAISQLANNVENETSKIEDSFGESFNNVADKVGEAMNDVASEVESVMDGVDGKVGNALGNVEGSVDNTIANVEGSLNGVASEIDNTLGEVSASVEDNMDKSSQAINDTSAQFTTGVQTMNQSAQQMSGATTTFASSVQSNMTKVSSSMQGASTSTSEYAQKAEQDLGKVQIAIAELEKQLRSGAVSAEEFQQKMRGLQVQSSNLAKEIHDAKKPTVELDESTQQLEVDWGKAGTAWSAALGGLALGLKESNPILSQAVGSLQKMAPLLAEMATAAAKGGKALKTAFASTGVGLLIVAIEEVISVVMSLVDAHKQQEQAAQDARDAEVQAAKDSKDAWLDYWQSVKDALDTRSSAEKELEELNFRIASIEKRKQESEEHDIQLEATYQQQLEDFYARRVQLQKQIADETKKASSTTSSALKTNTDDANNLTSAFISMYEKYKSANALQEIRDDLVSLHQAYNEGIISLEEYEDAVANAQKKYAEIVHDSLGIAEVKMPETKESEDPLIKQWKERVKASGEATAKIKADAIAQAQAQADLMNTVADVASSFASAYDTIEGVIADNLDVQLEAGDITQEEYDKQKSALKAFSIASIVAQTALGIASVWAAYSEKSVAEGGVTAPINAALAAGQTAVQLASGIAGIAALNSNNLSSTTTFTPTATVSTSDVQVNNPNYTDIVNAIDRNATSVGSAVSEAQVVLVVDDVNKVQNNQKKVKAVASF